MSTNGSKIRLWKIAGDAIAVATGIGIFLTSLAHPALDTTGLGVGLVSLGATHLEEDLASLTA